MTEWSDQWAPAYDFAERIPWIILPNGHPVLGEKGQLHDDLMDMYEVTLEDCRATGEIVNGHAMQIRPAGDDYVEQAQDAYEEALAHEEVHHHLGSEEWGPSFGFQWPAYKFVRHPESGQIHWQDISGPNYTTHSQIIDKLLGHRDWEWRDWKTGYAEIARDALGRPIPAVRMYDEDPVLEQHAWDQLHKLHPEAFPEGTGARLGAGYGFDDWQPATDPWEPKAWIYDPETDKLYTGEWHARIISQHPELQAKTDNKDYDRAEAMWYFDTPLVLGWILDGEPSVQSDYGRSQATPEQQQRGLEKATEYFSGLTKTAMPYDDNTWYHVTDGSALPRITQEGLVGSEQGTNRTWGDYPVEHSAVYLWPNVNQAWSYVQSYPDRWDNPTILRVRNVDRSQLGPDHEMAANWYDDRAREETDGVRDLWTPEQGEWFDWLHNWHKTHPYNPEDPADTRDKSMKWYERFVHALRDMPPQMREPFAKHIAEGRGDAVMHYGPIDPRQIEVGRLNVFNKDNEYPGFEYDEPEPDYDEDEAYEQWLEDRDAALDSWMSEQGNWVHPDETKTWHSLGLDDPTNDSNTHNFTWMPLGQHLSAWAPTNEEMYKHRIPWWVDMHEPRSDPPMWIGNPGDFHPFPIPVPGEHRERTIKGYIDTTTSPPTFNHYYGLPGDPRYDLAQEAVKHAERAYYQAKDDPSKRKVEASVFDTITHQLDDESQLAKNRWGSGVNWDARTPYVYDRENDILHWGQPGWWHTDLQGPVDEWYWEHAQEPSQGRYLVRGAIGTYPDGRKEHGIYDWTMPENPAEYDMVADLLEERVGVPLSEHTPDDILDRIQRTQYAPPGRKVGPASPSDEWAPKVGHDEWEADLGQHVRVPAHPFIWTGDQVHVGAPDTVHDYIDFDRSADRPLPWHQWLYGRIFPGGYANPDEHVIVYDKDKSNPQEVYKATQAATHWMNQMYPSTIKQAGDLMSDSADNWWGPASVTKFDVDVPGQAPGMGGIGHELEWPCWCDVASSPHEWSPACENGKRPTMEHEAGMTVPQQLRQWETLQPHSHVPVHEFPNGWTIRQCQTPEDITAIGRHLQNCWQSRGREFFDAYGDSPSVTPKTCYGMFDENGLPVIAFYQRPSFDGWKDGNPAYSGEKILSPLGRNNRHLRVDENKLLSEYAQQHDLKYTLPPYFTEDGQWRKRRASDEWNPDWADHDDYTTLSQLLSDQFGVPMSETRDVKFHVAKTAADDVPGMPHTDSGHWVWLDGHVAFGGDHHETVRSLARQLGYDSTKTNYISNMIARNCVPEEHAVAVGEMRDGYPQIWFSTRDRNAVWDDVARARDHKLSWVDEKFQMPMEIEQSFVATGECPYCKHALRQGPSGLYCQYCGWEPRVAANWWKDPDIADWQHGMCDTYAFALCDMYPHLRLGTLDGGRHFFAHDDQYAYDSLGRHSLPYEGIEGNMEPSLNEDPAWYKTSTCPYGENGGLEDYERAKRLIPQQHPWLSQKTAASALPLEFVVREPQQSDLDAMPADDYTNPDEVAMMCEAFLNGHKIGHLYIDDYGEIKDVEVLPEFRRQGVATAMLERLRSQGYDVYHSEDLTDEGQAWADHVGSKTAGLKDDALKAYEGLLATGGFSLTQSLVAASGEAYFVSVEGHERQIPLETFSPQDILAYRKLHLPELHSDPNFLIGGWLEGDSVCLDLSRAFQSQDEAVAFGRANNQRAVWDGFNNREIRLDVPEDEIREARLRKLGKNVQWAAPIYSEHLVNEPKTSMAERSGDPQLDALIEQFMREEDEYLTGGGDPNLPDYRKPEDSGGHCADIGEYLMLWLQQHGVDAQPYDGITHGTGEGWGLIRNQFNYHEAPYFAHSAVLVNMPSGTYLIDFSASQFGYKEFPMVQRLDDQGGWQREWRSSVPLDQTAYIAEGAMERAGFGTRKWISPKGRYDETPEIRQREVEMEEYVKSVTGLDYVRVSVNSWETERIGVRGSAQWVTSTIYVPHETTDLTLIHEAAHLIRKSSEGDGHDTQWCEIARDLYAKAFGDEAAEIFWNLVSFSLR